jgi:hypothetical protein
VNGAAHGPQMPVVRAMRSASAGSAESANAAYLSLKQVRGAPDPLQRKGWASCQTGLARANPARADPSVLHKH